MSLSIRLDPHPSALPAALLAEFSQPLGNYPPGPAPSAAPAVSETLRQAVRHMLRQAGYKPTGRGKPSSEYLAKAAAEGNFPTVNPAVDAGNRLSLGSGLPVSVIDLDRARPPFTIALAAAGQEYVFNASGQTIDVEGLLCLFDAEGPCANPVKDAQRTKTTADSRRCLIVIWGLTGQPQATQALLSAFQAELASFTKVLSQVPLASG